MYNYERNVLSRITEKIRNRYPERIVAVYAFGSKVRGDQDEWSDFDVLVVVRDRNPSIENEIISIFVEEEIHSGLNFTPVIKDAWAFQHERDLHTPFYEVLQREGIVL